MLKFSSDVKAGALMESIDGAYCSEPTTSSPRLQIAVWPVVLGDFIVVERPAVLEGIWRARWSRENRC